MNKPATLRQPGALSAKFDKQGALREMFGDSGRVHLDRWLHFLVLHRGPADDHSVARRVARNSPAYLVWDADDDEAALGAFELLADRIVDRFGRMLVIWLDDRDVDMPGAKSGRLPKFEVRLGAGSGPRVDHALDGMEAAMAKVRIDLRRCQVARDRANVPEEFERTFADREQVAATTMAIPQIHRSLDGETYPQLLGDLVRECGDAILRGACAWLDDGKTDVPKHFRALGRSAFLAAALHADKKLDKLGNSFDFLLSVSPINTDEAMEEYLEDPGRSAPRFRYRPLTIEPDLVKRDLYDLDLNVLEDPTLENLFVEKRHEIDLQLTMLATRNTPAFRPASMALYGGVEPRLLEDAKDILASRDKKKKHDRERVGARQLKEAAERLADKYREQAAGFDPLIEIREDVASLLVSGPKLMIASASAVSQRRVDPLLSHEVSVHLLTCFNGEAQGLRIFRNGLAGYEGIQEGLGVFAEWAVGGLTRPRLRLLAGRVVAVDAMIQGADFTETYRLLRRDFGFRRRRAFKICARVYRSGGLAKDAIYLKGFRQVVDMVSDDMDLTPFWLGKIAPRHVDAVEEMLQRGLLSPPKFTPEFLLRKDVKKRIANLRGESTIDDVMELG